MADKLIVTKDGIKEVNFTEEELEEIKKRQEEEKNKPEPQPTKEELQAKKIEELEKQLATCQQSIVELTALAAIGTPE